MTEQQRIEYLLGPWHDRQFNAEGQDWNHFLSVHGEKAENQIHLTLDGHVIHDGLESPNPPIYLIPFQNMLRRINATDAAPHCTESQEVIMNPGDKRNASVTIPMFAKTRGIGGGAILVQSMEIERHWTEPCRLDTTDREWEDKHASAVWRGTTTGSRELDLNARVSFVRQFLNHGPTASLIDVGFNFLCQGWDTRDDVDVSQWLKAGLSVQEMLSHKFVVSIEGNDVATNVKWVMGSNSVPFMPAPTAESWGLEGTLRANVHFVELSWDEQSGWNLEEKIKFCIDHDAECKEIAMNGKRFMQHYRFCDRQYQQELEAKVMDRFCQQMTIHIEDA